MIVELAQIVFGLALYLFVPGYLVVVLFFKKSSTLEKILLSIVFSLMIGMAIGVFFGYDRAQAARFGGFKANNVFTAELIVTTLLLGAVILKKYLGKPKEQKRTPPPAKQKKVVRKKAKKKVARKKATNKK